MYALMNAFNNRMLRTYVEGRKPDRLTPNDGTEQAPSTFESYEDAASAAAVLSQRRAEQNGKGVAIHICELRIVSTVRANVNVEVLEGGEYGIQV